jgi:mannose/cellobiose epimerase-like protein (N-acyl-D-glucosamine 2-epimerase family)
MVRSFTFLVLLLVQQLFSQYTITSPYLKAPETMFGFVDSCAKFWMKAYDPVNGGYFVNINRQGAPFGTSLKNTLNQSRDAYGFTRAFQMTGDTSYLRYARYGLDFMYKNSWDKTYGGWYNDIGNTGTPTNPNGTKTAFYQHYALLGIAASYEATGDTADLAWLMKGYAYNEAKLWDKDASYFGYYDYVAANGTSPTNKTFNSTVDAITTHVLHLYLMTGEAKYKTRLLELADNMIYWMAANAKFQKIGFPEVFNSQWQIKSGTSDEQRTIMGHVLKTAWCLGRIYQLEKNPVYLATAEDLAQGVLAKGYDHQNGGPYKDYNRLTGAMMMYGITDTAKAWWQMEQAVTAGLMLHHLTGKDEYLKMADGSLDFFMKYFVDHVYGDVFENANKYGGMITQWGTTKGGSGKAGYHSIETGYYTYLYGKLMTKKEPTTLYYRYTAMDVPRTLRMRPIGLPEGTLKIASVKRNGTQYGNFDSTNLQLTLPSGTDGIFAVTYAPVSGVLSVAERGTVPEAFTLEQNYPNPFNPSTKIGFTLHVSGNATLTVYDVLGRSIATLAEGYYERGVRYTVQFDAKDFAGGTYFAVLRSGGESNVRKMLLLR